MSSSREKDKTCSCNHVLKFQSLDNLEFVEKLDKDFRYEIFLKDKFYSFLEYIDSEDRWFFFTKMIELKRDENNNLSTHILEESEIERKENG